MNYPILGGEYCTNVPLDNLNRELRVGYTGYGKKKMEWTHTSDKWLGNLTLVVSHFWWTMLLIITWTSPCLQLTWTLPKTWRFWWYIWRFPNMGDPPNEWFMKENPIKNGWFESTHVLGNHHFGQGNGVSHDWLLLPLIIPWASQELRLLQKRCYTLCARLAEYDVKICSWW